MSRPRHSNGGFRRYMQISRTQLFIFVEGKVIDPHFYGKVCESAFQSTKIRYRIQTAKELPGETGGKKSLISFFYYLKRNSSLIDGFNDEKTASFFFLDKDIDEFLNKKLRSRHVIYTKYYDVENHIYREGNIQEGVAAAASLDPQIATQICTNNKDWSTDTANKWRHWIKLCMFERKKKLNCGCRYSRASCINVNKYGAHEDESYNQYLSVLKRESGLTESQFKRSYKRISDKIDFIFDNGEYDLVFKGKWYAQFLNYEINELHQNRPANIQGFLNRITGCIVAAVNFDAQWADHFKIPIQAVASEVI